MFRAISDSLHKELLKKDDFNRIDLAKNKKNYNKTVEIRNNINNKIDFLVKLRKAVNDDKEKEIKICILQ